MSVKYVDYLVTPDGVRHGYPMDNQFDTIEEAIADAKDWLTDIKAERPTQNDTVPHELERRQRAWDCCREANMHNTVKIVIEKITVTVEKEIPL